MAQKIKLPYILILPTYIIVVVLVAYPIFDVIRLSFTDLLLLRPGTGKFVGLKTFIQTFTDPVFPLVIRNTILWMALATVLSIGVGLVVGYFISFDWRINRLLRAVILIPWILPPVISASIWKWMVHSDFGVVNDMLIRLRILTSGVAWLGEPRVALYVLILVMVWKNVPMLSILLSAAFQGVPNELLEAATIDGASGWQKFRRISLPTVSYTLLILMVIVSIWNIQQFVIIWITTRGGPINYTHILPTYIYEMAFTNFRFGQAAALSVITIIILMGISVVYLMLFRRTAKKD
jgi:multiple sugar transport system permease protein